ncbi:hypothetical protein AB0M36_24930 [Actinoplanes sp. NPDC051346]|uniref:sulfurtransferase TusA family protein n=1 Tax=Actinoplanes sp. NPDC051346 TaxID=3155048 RepID=UPI00342C9FD9
MNTTPAGANPTRPSPTGSVLVLDGGDRRCVQLLLELRPLTLQAAPGTVIHIRTTDPAAPLDLPAWCHLTGHTYLGPVQSSPTGTTTSPAYALEVADDAVATEPGRPWRPSRLRGAAAPAPPRLIDEPTVLTQCIRKS